MKAERWVIDTNVLTSAALLQGSLPAALAAKAHWLVSGDSDLLTLGQVEEVVMLTPAQALRRLEGGRGG